MPTPPQRQLLELTIAPSDQEVPAASPVIVGLSLKNQSEEAIAIWETHVDWDFEFTVRNSDGRIVPLTVYGRRMEPSRGLETIRRKKVLLKPGAQQTYQVPVNRKHDMTLTGGYTIRAIFRSQDPDFAIPAVTSNAVRVLVTGE